MWRDPDRHKYLSGPKLSGNRITNSSVRVKIGWTTVLTGVWPALIVFDVMFIQWYYISIEWTGSSNGGKMTDMLDSCKTDQCFPVSCLAQGAQ